jgi:predicted nucleic acid-binding protein
VSEPFKLGGTLRENLALIDTSAVLALLDNRETLHNQTKLFFEECLLDWAAVDLTAHETFTRIRSRTNVGRGFEGFDFLRTDLTVIDFQREDEARARSILTKYADHKISYHDAICAAVMLRSGIYKIFTFDKDFLILGFKIIPGPF